MLSLVGSTRISQSLTPVVRGVSSPLRTNFAVAIRSQSMTRGHLPNFKNAMFLSTHNRAQSNGLEENRIVWVLGARGKVGQALRRKIAIEQPDWKVIAINRSQLKRFSEREVCFSGFDLSDPDKVKTMLQKASEASGEMVPTIVDATGYYHLGPDQDLEDYRNNNVMPVRNLLQAIDQSGLKVAHYIHMSTIMVNQPSQNGGKLSLESPLVQSGHPYYVSKAEGEQVALKERGNMKVTVLRLPGVYSDKCDHSALAMQIDGIRRKSLTSYFYPGRVQNGFTWSHMDDVVNAVNQCVIKGESLPEELVLFIGEENTTSYDEIQRAASKAFTGSEMLTLRVPKLLAKMGAYMMPFLPKNAGIPLTRSESESLSSTAWFTRSAEALLPRNPGIHPWMVDIAGADYPLDISKTKEFLEWSPSKTLVKTLPKMAKHIESDPAKWCEDHGLRP